MSVGLSIPSDDRERRRLLTAMVYMGNDPHAQAFILALEETQKDLDARNRHAIGVGHEALSGAALLVEDLLRQIADARKNLDALTGHMERQPMGERVTADDLTP